LARYQYLHAGGLDVVDMHKNIGAAAIGRDEAIFISQGTDWRFFNELKRELKS
jgi:hypothetical protein